MHAFRWREEESLTSGKTILRPTLDLELRLGAERTATKALVDTGAPRTIFPRGVGDLMGIEFPTLPSDAPTRITVLGRVWPAVSETVQLNLKAVDADSWEAEVDFVVEEGLPFALLGYEGFLNHWAVGINGYTGYFFVEAIDDFDERHAEALEQLDPRR